MAKSSKAFVAGWPIKHSRSPLIHNHWLAVHGLDGDYSKQEIEPANLGEFLSTLDKQNFRGGNITIPHKENALELLDEVDELADRLGAVNTIWLDENKNLCGSNTDGFGFTSNLNEHAPTWNNKERQQRPVLVLGAGGASRAIVDALVQQGFEKIVIANRTISRAVELVQRFGTSCSAIALDELNICDLKPAFVVNTTSLGMEGSDTRLPIDLAQLPTDAIVTDIVYTPLMTPLLNEAKSNGLQIVDGLGMLLHQAVPGFEKWFGIRPQVTPELRQILLRDLVEAPTGDRTVFLGLTGSIGMGKSTTAQMFRECGIPVNDSDAVVHKLYSGRAAKLVEAQFPGTTIDNVVDRQKLSKYVIGDEANMKKLEAIVHPLVREEEEKFRERVKSENAPLAIFDSPLLFERNAQDQVDGIIVVTAPEEVQRKRVMSRPGMSEDKFKSLLARQVPDDEKRKKADFIIDTSRGLDAAFRDVEAIIEAIHSQNWNSSK